MEDRLPKYPGRVTLTPVAGLENTFDMAMADEPTIDGTPLNKATLLQDATASAIDQSNPPTTPNEAFSKLNGLLGDAASAISALQTSRARIVAGSYVGTRTGTVETVPVSQSYDKISVSSGYAIPVIFEKPPLLFWIFNVNERATVHFGLGTSAGGYNDEGVVAPYLLPTAAFPTTGSPSTVIGQFQNGFLSSYNTVQALTRYANNRIYCAYANLSTSSTLPISSSSIFNSSDETYKFFIVYDY